METDLFKFDYDHRVEEQVSSENEFFDMIETSLSKELNCSYKRISQIPTRKYLDTVISKLNFDRIDETEEDKKEREKQEEESKLSIKKYEKEKKDRINTLIAKYVVMGKKCQRVKKLTLLKHKEQ